MQSSSLWREYLKTTDLNHDVRVNCWYFWCELDHSRSLRLVQELVASTKQVLDGAVGQDAAPEGPTSADAF